MQCAMGIVLRDVVRRVELLEDEVGHSMSSDKVLLTDHLRQCLSLSNDIKTEVKLKGLKSIEDEVAFFKTIKPRLTGLYYFYRRALDILERIPAASSTVKVRVLEDERRKLDNFALNQQQLQAYLNRGQCHNDEVYYTRKWDDTEIFEDYRFVDLDRTYSTRKGFPTARLLVHPHLYRFIDKQINLINNQTKPVYEHDVKWIGKKINLVTLIYGLVETKQVDADVAQVAKALSGVLSVELNNVYGMWADVKMRKKEKLPFIKQLDEVLTNKIIEEQ